MIMAREADEMSNAPARLGLSERSVVNVGVWRPTPPNNLPPAHPGWATMRPFALTSPSQFRPAGPPAVDTEAFKKARIEVSLLGAASSTTRTAEQTEIAQYWSDAIGSFAPAGHWNAIAASIVSTLGLGIAAEAELFAELNVAIADTGIAMADASCFAVVGCNRRSTSDSRGR